MAVVDYFLKLDGIRGESTDSKHKDEIEIDSFSWGATQTGTFAFGGGAGAGKVSFQDFHFTTRVNRSSPTLMLKCAAGEHIKQAVLTARRSDSEGGGEDFLKVALADVLVSSYQDGGAATRGGQDTPGNSEVISNALALAASPADLPIDSVALRYAKVTVTSGGPTRGPVSPGAKGMILLDHPGGSFQVVDSPNGIFTIGRQGEAISRAVLEYDVKILIGLLTAPFSALSLKLVTAEVRGANEPPTDVVNGESTEAGEPKKAKKLKFDVILYTPADLVLGPDDLTVKGKRIGTIRVDPDGDPATLETDLTKLLRKRGLETFGIRLQLRGARVKPPEDDDDESDEDVEAVATDNDDPEDDRRAKPDATASFTVELVMDTL
jgi:type VI secretion system secreted protein Hcp